MLYKNIETKIQKLKSKGLIENIDFRIVYFSDKTEIKIISK